MRFLTVFSTAALLTVISLSGCAPYQMDVAQGNVITQEMIDQLRPGMTQNQVRFILGTPMIADSFHTNRWDYYYSFRRGSETEPKTRHIAIIFQNGALASIEGDVAAKKPADTVTETKTPNS